MSKKTTPSTTTTTPEPKTGESFIAENTKITITIPWKDAEPGYKKARAKVAQTTRIAGFRKGKVPPDVAEKMLGSEQIIEKAMEYVLPDAYVAALKAQDKKPLTQPTFSAVSVSVGSDWIIEAQIAEKPEISLGDYKKEVQKVKAATEKELAAKEKEALKTKSDKKDEKTADTAPATPDKPMSDAARRDHTLQHIYEALITTAKPKIAELLVRREIEYDLEQLARQLQALNMTFPQYLERRQISQEQLTQQMAFAALGRLQLVFIMNAIATAEKILVSDEYITTYINEKVEPSIREQYSSSEEYRNMLRETLARQKVADFLLAL